MAKQIKAYDRIEKALAKQKITDDNEIRGKCLAEYDDAMIKMYRKFVDDLDEKQRLEKELVKINNKIAKLGPKEEAIAVDYLGKWPQAKGTALSNSYKSNLKAVAQRHNKQGGGAPVAKRTTWTEDKIITALEGTQRKADTKGLVEGKTVMEALNAPSIDVLSQRLAGRTGDIIAIIGGKTSEPVINAQHKVPKKEGARAKYTVNVSKVLERLNG